MATATIEADPRNLYRARPDLVYGVSREFMRSCPTPMPVMADDAPAQPLQTSVDVAESLHVYVCQPTDVSHQPGPRSSLVAARTSADGKL